MSKTFIQKNQIYTPYNNLDQKKLNIVFERYTV